MNSMNREWYGEGDNEERCMTNEPHRFQPINITTSSYCYSSLFWIWKQDIDDLHPLTHPQVAYSNNQHIPHLPLSQISQVHGKHATAISPRQTQPIRLTNTQQRLHISGSRPSILSRSFVKFGRQFNQLVDHLSSSLTHL